MKKQTENTTQNTPPTGGTSGSVPGAVVTGDLSPVKTAPVTTVPGTGIDALTRLQAENEQLKTTIRLSAAQGRSDERRCAAVFDRLLLRATRRTNGG